MTRDDATEGFRLLTFLVSDGRGKALESAGYIEGAQEEP
jgi:hypothetical protein